MHALIVDVIFGGTCNQIHGADNLYRKGTGSGFAGKHDRTGTVIDRVGNVCDLGTCRTRIGNHRFQHLGCSDDLLARLIALANQLLLDRRNLLKGDFYAHVAAGHHNAVRTSPDSGYTSADSQYPQKSARSWQR